MAKEVNKRVNIWLNEQGIDNNLKSIRAAITKTANELNKLPIGSEEWYRKSEKLKKLKDIQLELRKETKLTAEAIKEHNEKLNDTVVAAGAISAVYATASSAIRRFISTTQEYVDAYASLDDAMTSVSKYTGLTREEVKQLNEEFKRMDTRTPIEKLNALAADAGRLGITSKEAIKDFVEAADIINIALGEDLGEDAVKNIGKMAQMFGETENMGLRGAMIATASAINTLAQSSSASEPYIMDFSARLAGVANTAGITQAQIMGIASAMDQNMALVERSATAVQKVMMDMMGKTEKYANLVGMTADEFRRILEVSATEFANGTSMMEEFGTVNNNAAAQLEKAKNEVQDAEGIAYLAIKNKARILEIKNQAVEKVSNTLRNISIRTHVKKKVALTAETAATEAKRLAEMKARLETLKGVAADNQLRAVLQQETVVKTANAAATRAQAQE